MLQQFKMIKTIREIDNEILRKNVIPMILCFGTWTVTILYLISHTKMGIATIAILLLITIQLLSSISDLYNKAIPLKLMICGLLVGFLIFIIFYKTNLLINCILGGIVAFGLMKLLILISKRQVGGGDLALMTVTGFFAGINSFFSILFVSIVLAGMFSLLLILLKKGNKKTEIPFAPFILLATVICVLSGVQ
jgi:leader peptidase (prepilin peptidase) / N-methyltransferase